MSETTLTIKTVPTATCAVSMIQVQCQGGPVFRKQFRATLFNSDGVIITNYIHQMTQREWENWGSSKYDAPYVAKIILKRIAKARGESELVLAEDDDLRTAVDGEGEDQVSMIDEFNAYDTLITQWISEEEAEALAEAPSGE